MKKEKISNNVIRRLPRYLRRLDELTDAGVSRISSTELGQLLGFTPSQIRQDFNCFGEFGQQGYGYNVPALREQIAGILGMDRGYKAVLIGVGHIGRALIDNFCFSEWGINLVQAFDVDTDLIGKEFSGVHVSSVEDLTAYLKKNKVDIVVLAVPRDVALSTAEMLIDNGVHAIWNFTNVELVEPDSPVIVENVHFSDSLLALSYYVSDAYDSKKLKK
ncbi:MAG: redox-sensing transcriptional repressor Rex [Oscillospiraceae bacterium]|nr:redox-sensing transcriptional repressor Rex [Oscillospiraceae bacterium]